MAANTSPIFPLTPRIGGALVGASAVTARTAITGTTGLTLISASGSFGTRWDRIWLKGTGTTLAGLIDIWIYDGTTSRAYEALPVTVVTASTTVDSFETYHDFTTLVLPSTYSLYCSSQVASQLITVWAFGGDY